MATITLTTDPSKDAKLVNALCNAYMYDLHKNDGESRSQFAVRKFKEEMRDRLRYLYQQEEKRIVEANMDDLNIT